jgi:hypothetical protein
MKPDGGKNAWNPFFELNFSIFENSLIWAKFQFEQLYKSNK